MLHYGHGSWVVVIVFGGLLLLRVLASRKRPGGSHGGGRPAPPPYGASSFFSGTPSRPTSSNRGTSTGIPAGWMTDPSGKYDLRYWSGTAWTEHVTKNGVPAVDPPPGQTRATHDPTGPTTVGPVGASGGATATPDPSAPPGATPPGASGPPGGDRGSPQ